MTSGLVLSSQARLCPSCEPSQNGKAADFQHRQNLSSPVSLTAALTSSMSTISTRLVGSPGGIVDGTA